ncbi:bifunctional transcriptional activator/DNA repair enzyme AdaA [Falsibacillus albus]
MKLSFEEMWEKIIACDSAYDGMFYTAVKTTKIYCRPSCRSRKPKKINVEFYRYMSEAEEAGFRACKRCQPDSELSPQMVLVKNVSSFLIEHFKERVKLQDIAHHIGVSPFYMERVYKKETGETPNEYLEKVRIDKAAFLLRHTSKTNLEICFEAGYHSPSNFYKVFRRLKGCTPSEYRKYKHEEKAR